MVNVDLPIFHIHIRQRQTHKLGNPKPGLEQNIDTIIVFAKMLVTRHKFKKRSFLLSGNRFPCHAVVDYDGGKLKFKWILAYQIIIDGHLKGWSDNPPDRMNGAVTSTVLLQLYQPAFRVRLLHFVNPALTEFLFLNDIEDKVVIGLCIMPDACFLHEIFSYQFLHSHFTTARYNLIVNIFLNQFFFLPQRKIVPLARWQLIRFLQFPAINKLGLSCCVDTFERISSIFALALSVAKNTISVISSFLAHRSCSFL